MAVAPGDDISLAPRPRAKGEPDMDMNQVMEQITAFVTQWGLKVVGALAVLLVGRIVAGMMRGAVRRALQRADVDATLRPFLSGLVYYLALAVVLIAVLNLFGIQTASLIAVLGAAGLAVGLALQGTLSNFASGVMLLVFRPFQAGNYVEVAGTAGSVEQVGVFNTTLKSPDNVRIVVPNSQIYGSTIKNYNGFETRRIDMVMGISYDDDIGLAAKTIGSILEADPRVLKDPAPVVAVSELADSSVNLVVRPWCQGSDYWALKWDLTRQMKEGLEEAGCSIPYPQHDVHLKQETHGG
jgi:small conductance mechanosensitive channel